MRSRASENCSSRPEASILAVLVDAIAVLLPWHWKGTARDSRAVQSPLAQAA